MVSVNIAVPVTPSALGGVREGGQMSTSELFLENALHEKPTLILQFICLVFIDGSSSPPTCTEGRTTQLLLQIPYSQVAGLH